jgi:hypothetical protein
MDHNPQGQGGRRHFHRGRRGPDRRGPDRRGPQQHVQEQPSRGEVEVEQIMRDIRSRISQRHGIELTNQQIQELAARRLESILDPRSIKPALLDQLRRAAGTSPDVPAPRQEPPYTFEDTTLYDSHRGIMRFIRKLLNPILKLFFNPNPLIRALNIQARINNEMLAREAERDRRQAEWNALHYELLHRVVTEIARVTLEGQNIGLRMESLAGKVDFNERRVRGIEGAIHQARPAGRRDDTRRDDTRREVQEIPPPQVVVQTAEGGTIEPSAPAQSQPSEGTRRRRRRRRGRRGAAVPGEVMAGAAETTVLDVDEPDEGGDEDEGTVAPEPADVAVQGEDPPMMLEAEALVAEALSNDVTVEVSADAARPVITDQETVVVVAEEERPRQEPISFESVAQQEPVSEDLTPTPQPEAMADDLARPTLPGPRDLEPTDK